jgi:hypothetical protein
LVEAFQGLAENTGQFVDFPFVLPGHNGQDAGIEGIGYFQAISMSGARKRSWLWPVHLSLVG